jgi:maltose-binding protein MalE
VIANYNEVSQAMGQAIEAVLLGKGQPQQELDQAAQQADQTLATGQ